VGSEDSDTSGVDLSLSRSIRTAARRRSPLEPSTFDLRPSTFDLRPSTFDLRPFFDTLRRWRQVGAARRPGPTDLRLSDAAALGRTWRVSAGKPGGIFVIGGIQSVRMGGCQVERLRIQGPETRIEISDGHKERDAPATVRRETRQPRCAGVRFRGDSISAARGR
jgi:hypothetical protein